MQGYASDDPRSLLLFLTPGWRGSCLCFSLLVRFVYSLPLLFSVLVCA